MRWLAPWAPLLIACSTSSELSLPGAGAGGHDDAPLDVSLGQFTGVDVPLVPLAPGQELTLTAAVQGGYVVYIAPRVRGLTTGEVEVRARVRDPASDELLIDEVRTPRLIAVSGDPSLFEPDLGQSREINHLVLCPHHSESVVLGRDLELEVTVTERAVASPRHGVVSLPVRFACAPDGDLPLALRCSCQCAPDAQQEALCYPDEP